MDRSPSTSSRSEPCTSKGARIAAIVFAGWWVPATGAAPVCGQANLTILTRRIHVSPEGTDSTGCGAAAAGACRTIQQGIDNCRAGGCGVLVRWGLYPVSATIQMRDGVNVYGGCVFDGSAGTPYRSVVQASPAPGMPALSAANINTPTLLYGLVVIGKDEMANSTASLGMTVSNSKGLTIGNTVLASGKGGDGAPGTSASPGGQGEDGSFPPDEANGGGGGIAYPSNPAGGPGNGGQGADQQAMRIHDCIVNCDCDNTNYPNSLGRPGQNSGAVQGGAGGNRGGKGCGCNGHDGVPDGGIGNPGADGPCASGGGSASPDIWGGFQNTNWLPGIGGTGGTGSVGSGAGTGDPAACRHCLEYLTTFRFPVCRGVAVEEAAVPAAQGASRAAPRFPSSRRDSRDLGPSS